MATEKQIAANRQNAKFSTGPRTEHGKRRASRNALRHGLTAETVIDVLEDPRAYKTLQRAIYADYCPRSNFELELVAQLVSLLWRLRRAVAIETGLMAIQAKCAPKKHTRNVPCRSNNLELFYTLAPSLAPKALDSDQSRVDLNGVETDDAETITQRTFKSGLVHSFMRSSRLDGDVFERLGRYETRLWRQVVQIMLLLNAINRSATDHVHSNGTYLRLRELAAKRRHILWPPFPIEET